MDKQLEFILPSGEQGVLVGASNLVNSANWTGELWYFLKEEDIVSDDDVITENTSYMKYSLPVSVCDGAFLNDKRKLVVGNDTGWLSVYSIIDRDEDKYSESECSKGSKSSDAGYIFTNDLGRVEHDRSILSVSVSNNSQQKIASGSMDCSIIIWDSETFSPEIVYNAAHSHHVTCICFAGCEPGYNGDADSAGNEILASTSLDGYCLLWDRRQTFPARILSKVENNGLTAVAWLDNQNQLIVGCETGDLMLIDTRNSKDVIHSSESFSKSVCRIKSCNHDNKRYIAVSADDRTVKVLRCDEYPFEEIYRNDYHNDFVRGLTWLPSYDKLLSCSWDSKILKHYPFRPSEQ